VAAGAGARLRRWIWSTQRAPGAAHGLGNFLARLGEDPAAERPLLRAAARSPDFFEPHLDLGLVYRRLGLRREALLAFRRAKALAPDHPGLEAIEPVRE
jgi:Flp pilus assembly protein TadD